MVLTGDVRYDPEAEEGDSMEPAGLGDGGGFHIDGDRIGETGEYGVGFSLAADEKVAAGKKAAVYLGPERKRGAVKGGVGPEHLRQSLDLPVGIACTAPNIVVHNSFGSYHIEAPELGRQPACNTGVHYAVERILVDQLCRPEGCVNFSYAAFGQDYLIVPDHALGPSSKEAVKFRIFLVESYNYSYFHIANLAKISYLCKIATKPFPTDMNQNLKLLLMAALTLSIPACKGGTDGANSKPAIPVDSELEAKVEKTLKGMTLEEKVGQMMQLSVETVTLPDNSGLDMEKLGTAISKYKVGSILNVFAGTAQDRFFTAEYIGKIQELSMKEIGIPCIYGLDMIHGASYLSDGTFFPQEINLAATFNPEHARKMGEIMAYETRAAMCPWVFSPVMDLARNPAWSRVWESYGEDPYLQSVMASTETRALQGDDPNHIDGEHVSVSLKHYMAYGAAATGRDRTPAYVSPLDLREKYFAPFKASIEAGALNIMVNSASINGVPMHANKELLTGWLKEGLNWDGMIVTDWADINNLWQREHVAADRKEALALGINAGIDMIMDPYDPAACEDIIAAVKEGLIPQGRIDDACRRILRQKYRLGLFDNPTWDVKAYDRYGCQEFKDASLAAAVESEVLLKNEGGLLPLRKGTRILVTGPNGNSIRSLNGGWSYRWQGTNEEKYVGPYNTIYEALKNEFGTVDYVPGVEYDDTYMVWKDEKNINIDAAVRAARSADVVVACVGENSYCETPGNLEDLNLSENQKKLVKALAATGKPIVLVLNEGRARIISDLVELPAVKAIVDVMLPSNYGGDALALLLSGKENFSGRLPFTYSKNTNDLHTYDYKVSENVATMAGAYNYDASMFVQWPFGTGLSYTTFEYSDLQVDKTDFAAGDVLNVKLTVKNTGSVAGKEAVLLYSSDLVASVIPDARRLRAFTKVDLQPGESKVVELSVPANSLAFVGQDGKWRLEKGAFRLMAGDRHVDVNCVADKVWKGQNIE